MLLRISYANIFSLSHYPPLKNIVKVMNEKRYLLGWVWILSFSWWVRKISGANRNYFWIWHKTVVRAEITLGFLLFFFYCKIVCMKCFASKASNRPPTNDLLSQSIILSVRRFATESSKSYLTSDFFSKKNF